VDTNFNDVMAKEGAPTNDSLDHGGATAFGISQKANPEAWKNGPPTEAEARAIFESKYLYGPKFKLIEDNKLQAQCIDYGFNSGSYVCIQKLQTILKVPVDGILGPQTLEALKGADVKDVNKQLVIARVNMLCKIVQKDPTQLKFIAGWCSRAMSFL
jgi:lysozyme family protein